MEIPGYRLGTVIGQGGMGRVYAGEQLTLKRQVAIKVLAPELMSDESLIKRFQLEVTILSGLLHPSIVRVIDSGFTGSTYFYAMEYCEGGTLKSRLKQHREDGTKYTPREAVDLGVALLEGLEIIHAKNIVHRDIKPGNIFFAENDRPVLGDFGLARDLAGVRLTLDPQSMGTPLYMSPEARIGENIDSRSDLFQIARVLYELLSGEDPNTSAPIWLRLTPKSEVPDLSRANPHVSPELAAVIGKALQWKADDRQQTARELRDDLANANLEVDPAALTARDVTPVPRGTDRNPTPRGLKQPAKPHTSTLKPNFRTATRPSGSRRRPAALLPAVLVSCALMLGLGTGAFLFWPGSTPSPSPSAGPAITAEPPRIEGLKIETSIPRGEDAAEKLSGRVPLLDLTVAPAARVEVSAGQALAPVVSALASKHRVPLGALPAGRHNLSIKLESAQGQATYTVPFAQTYPGAPPRHCLGLVLKECFDWSKHSNIPATYDHALLAGVGAAGASAAAVLVDPEREDDGLIPLVKRYREYGVEVELVLYMNKYPAQPELFVTRLASWIRLVASLGQKQLWFSPGILIDTLGWSEGWTRYRDWLALIHEARRDAPIPVLMVSGNLFSRDTQSLAGLMKSGAAQYLSGIVTTHRYQLKCAPRAPASLAPFETVALKFGRSKLDWIFDVSAPESGDTGLLEHELMGPVMADPSLRDVAASLDMRNKKLGQPLLELSKEEELYGSRMRETARWMAAGAMGAIWDQNLCRDTTEGDRLRFRSHPIGIRTMLDYMLAPPGEEAQPIASEAQRQRLGIESGQVEGLVRETPAGARLMLWTEATPRARVILKTSQPALITPLLQSQRGAFLATLKFPVSGRLEVPVGWAPVVIDLLP